MSARDHARQQLKARLLARMPLIERELDLDETVMDCGDVNELGLNMLDNLAAGEGLLFVTDRGLILYRNGKSEIWRYSTIRKLRLQRARRGVPNRSWMKELTIELPGSRVLLGGRSFLSDAVATARSRRR